MALFGVVTHVVLGVALLVAVTATWILRPAGLVDTARHLRERTRAVAGPALVLAATMALNGVLRNVSFDLSWRVGVNVTGYIYAIEGNLVPFVQSFASPPLTAFFSFAYVFGYAFVLVFPVVAYLSLADPRPLRTLLIAYIANYALGFVAYLFVIAYGPRNLIPELVDSLLYNTYPQFQLLTAEVNTNTNVFPSLHASLSVTVALVAGRTRDLVPRWFPLALALAISICVSTMYLGIHWAIDVLAGIALAIGAVRVASMDRWH